VTLNPKRKRGEKERKRDRDDDDFYWLIGWQEAFRLSHKIELLEQLSIALW
jgi:hypothetical protein